MNDWPKRTTIYLHANRENLWERGKELRLREKAIHENFTRALHDVAIDIDVYEDGTYTIIQTRDL